MSTGILQRDELLLNAARVLLSSGQDISIEELAKNLPADFALSRQDLIEMESEFAALKSETQPAVEYPVEAMIEQPVEAMVEPVSAEGASHLAVAQQELADARGGLIAAAQRERNSAVRLQRAIAAFSHGLVHLSPDQLLRDHCREQSELRARAAAGEIPQTAAPDQRPGPSLIDKLAWFAKPTTAEGCGNFRRISGPAFGRRVAPKFLTEP